MDMHRFLSVCLSTFVILVLTACSSGKIVKTYEGDVQPKDNVAVLTAGENITLISVNGKAVPKYLLSNIEVNYGLLSGQNSVVFQYRSVWSKAMRGDKDESRAEEVSSAPREVVLNASPGDKLVFSYEQPGNVREAKALAAAFEADIINQGGKVVARSGDLVSEVSSVAGSSAVTNAPVSQVPAAAQVLGSSMSVPATSTASGSSLSAIDGMKVLWKSASAEEKKAFLKWAFQ